MHVCMHVGPLGLQASEHCNCPSCSASLTSSSPWYPSWHDDAKPLDPSFCGSYEFGGKELWLGIWLVGLRLELQLEWQLEWLGLKWPEMDQDGLYEIAFSSFHVLPFPYPRSHFLHVAQHHLSSCSALPASASPARICLVLLFLHHPKSHLAFLRTCQVGTLSC